MENQRSKWISIPQNIEKTVFKGVLRVDKKDFMFELRKGPEKDLSSVSFGCDWELKYLLNGYENCLKERLLQAQDVDDFLNEVHGIAIKLQRMKQRRANICSNAPDTEHQSSIIKEIEQIGWGKLSYLDPSFGSLTLFARDHASRQHFLWLKFTAEDLSKRPSVQADLPSPFNPKWPSQDGTIKHIYQQFLEELKKHQDLWNILDEIDEKCWVLEPEVKLRSCCYRRVAIGNRSSLLVTINSSQPTALPECRFLGPELTVAPLLEKWNLGLYLWNQRLSVLQNLQDIMEIEFPSPTDSIKEDFSMDCCICYAYKLEDEIPQTTCVDSRCGRLFHSACLIEWIRSMPNFRQSFDVLFGECPYCSTPLTVKMCKKSNRIAAL